MSHTTSIHEPIMRKLKLYSLVILLALSFALPTTFAQRKAAKPKATVAATLSAARGVETITAEQFKDYLSFIASDEMEGRDTPSRGLDTTAKFIAMNLKRWGFKPAGDDNTFFQKIVLRRDQIDGAHSLAEINGQKFNFGDDFLPNAVSADLTGQLVYAGHGWVVKSKNIDAYQGIDVKDKIVVVFGEGMPAGVTRADLTGKMGEDWISPALYAQQHGAKGVLAIADYGMLLRWDQTRLRLSGGPPPRAQVEKFMTQAGPAVPVVWLSPKMATALFQGEKYSVSALMAFGSGVEPASVSAPNGPSVTVTLPFELKAGKNATLTIAAKNEKPITQNVVAVW